MADHQNSRRTFDTLFFSLTIAGVLAAAYMANGQERTALKNPRHGFVCLLFDNTNGEHARSAFHILKEFRLKGSFAVDPSKIMKNPAQTGIAAERIFEISKAGHEIMVEQPIPGRLTTAAQKEKWMAGTRRARDRLKEFGVDVKGWHQAPRGTAYSVIAEVRDILSQCYSYACFDNILKAWARSSIHWGFRGDRYLGEVAGDWLYFAGARQGQPITEEQAVSALSQMKTMAADAVQQGRLVTFAWHAVSDEDRSQWAVRELCKWLDANSIPVSTYGAAVALFQDRHKHLPYDVEQIPNPGLQFDLDGNSRPDGYVGPGKWGYAKDRIQSPEGGKVAEFRDGCCALVFGPEPGPTCVKFLVRSVESPVKVTMLVSVKEFDGKNNWSRRADSQLDAQFNHGHSHSVADVTLSVASNWQEITLTFDVPKEADGASVTFLMEPSRRNVRIYVASPSWRRKAFGPEKGELDAPAHPHVYFEKGEVAALTEKTKKPIAQDIWARVKDAADKMVASPFRPLGPKDGGEAVVHRAWNARVLSFVYALTSDARYARRAKEESETVLAAPLWTETENAKADLHTASITFSLAMAYDWMYDCLSPEDRERLRDGVFRRGLEPMFDLSAKGHFWASRHNWGVMIHGCAGSAAMVFLGEDPRVPQWIETCRRRIVQYLADIGSDGGYGEGVTYWTSAALNAAYFQAALQKLTKGEVDLFDDPRLKQTYLFPIYFLEPDRSGFVKFSDCWPGVTGVGGDFLYKFAAEQKNGRAQWIAELMSKDSRPCTGIFGFLWCDPAIAPESPSGLPLSRLFSGIDWAVLRTSWDDPNGILFAFKGGQGDWDHRHNDYNSFILNAFGEPLIIDQGYPRKLWGIRTEAHNTIMIDGKDQLGETRIAAGGGKPEYCCEIGEFLHSDWYDHLLGDATRGYAPDNLKRFTREVLFVRPDYFVIFDDVVAPKESRMDWHLHTFGQLAIKGDTITITQGKAAVDVKVIAPIPFAHQICRKTFEEVGIKSPFAGAEADTCIKLRPEKDTAHANFLTVLVPRRGAETPLAEIARIEQAGLLGANISRGGGRDLVLFPISGEMIDFEGVRCKGRSCWVRRDGGSSKMFAVNAATELECGDVVLFQSSLPVWAAVSMGPDKTCARVFHDAGGTVEVKIRAGAKPNCVQRNGRDVTVDFDPATQLVSVYLQPGTTAIEL